MVFLAIPYGLVSYGSMFFSYLSLKIRNLLSHIAARQIIFKYITISDVANICRMPVEKLSEPWAC